MDHSLSDRRPFRHHGWNCPPLVPVAYAAQGLLHLFLNAIPLRSFDQGGVCRDSFFLGQFACCWGISLLSDDPVCPEWRMWSDGVHSASLKYAIEYFFYVGFSVAFAGLAAVFVSTLATQAAHTGM